MDKGFSSDTVDLAEACKVLAKSDSVQMLLKEQVGSVRYPEALKLMEAGKLDSDLGATVHDFLLDAIVNNAKTVWSGFIHDENDDWPVSVNEYHEVFWVSTLECDPIGYFLNSESAIAYARTAWDNVYEYGEVPADKAEGDGEIRCPFCNTSDNCAHLLLMVDQTFRHAEGGILFEAFNARWAKILDEANDPDFDEREPFEELLQEVNSLADAEREASPESAPGMSSTYSFYYCSSKEKLQAALKKFTSE
ncbi:hypothetical protein MCEMIE11_00698 [Burkholderiales bacterium]